MELTAAQKIGQMLAVGFTGTKIPPELRDLVRDTHIGNVVLFSENVRDKVQLRALCADIQAMMTENNGIPAFIMIDQEGGVVSRLGSDAAVVPSAMCVAATGNTENARLAGRITGEELRAMGVNFDLAPVMDVNSNPANPVIGSRSYGDTPDAVAAYACAMHRGLTESGVLSCAKHFPGHGDTAVDSHLGLPCVARSREELEACELKPFRAAIRDGIPAIMTTHILFPALEPERIPATMSRRILTGLLREKYGFQGLILSDCMMMDAIKAVYGTVNGVSAAVRAGVDIALVSHSLDLARESWTRLMRELADGTLDAAQTDASAARILSAKRALPRAEGDLSVVGCAAHREAVRGIMRDGITLVSGSLPALGADPVFMGCDPFRASLVSDPETAGLRFPLRMQKAFGGDAYVTPADPTETDARMAAERAAGHTCAVVCTYNGNIRRGQLALVRAVAAAGVPTVCVALRNPYDLADLPENVTCVAAYAYDELALNAVIDVLRGDLKPKGKLPVKLCGR